MDFPSSSSFNPRIDLKLVERGFTQSLAVVLPNRVLSRLQCSRTLYLNTYFFEQCGREGLNLLVKVHLFN